MSVRISLDLSSGTFSKVEEICREGFQNKAQYLRMLVDENIVKRAESDEKKGREKAKKKAETTKRYGEEKVKRGKNEK